MSQTAGGAAAQPHKPHILPLKLYFFVAAALLVLTYVTVRVSYFHFGTWNLIVAMGVATIKASLVALFFMHLKYDERFNAVIFVGSLACLGIFFSLTLADTMERGALDPVKAGDILPVPGRPEFMERYGIEDGAAAGAADSTGQAAGAADSTGHGAAADTAGHGQEGPAGGH